MRKSVEISRGPHVTLVWAKTYFESAVQRIEKNGEVEQRGSTIDACCRRRQLVEDASQQQRYGEISKHRNDEERFVSEKSPVSAKHAKPDLHRYRDSVGGFLRPERTVSRQHSHFSDIDQGSDTKGDFSAFLD